tara:strand:- start:567 stop:689 length:123 start_codon:yes stop_codon:yes gene_type:complete
MSNSMKQNITQVVSWMKVNGYMKEEPKRGTNRKFKKKFKK